jgi:GrpB-like predicted nucleotidyltransferase (UPF0157 family)
MIKTDELKKFNLGMKNGIIKLSPHDSLWSQAFILISKQIREQLSLTIDLYHIGSTSIPGIVAKPVLDILAVVHNLDEFDRCRSDIDFLGFEWKGEYEISKRRYCPLYDNAKKIAYVHMHVFEKTNQQVESHLIFPEYLRLHPDDARKYENLKLNLAVGKREDYANGKADCIAEILHKALAWKVDNDK